MELILKASVVINNYNYEKYIYDCINSVINQTYKNIEIIIVDDGSTDSSVEIIKQLNDERIKLISKENAGQLSAFNESIKHVTGDIVFFLDSDDMYKEDYIQRTLEIYNRNKNVDFVFCELIKLINGKEIIEKASEKDVFYGYSMLSTLFTKEWLGKETSAVSMKIELLKKMLPIPFEENYITRADDCLIWASSLLGAKKYYFSEALVYYRIHGENNFHAKKIDIYTKFKKDINDNIFIEYFSSKNSLGDIYNIEPLIKLEFLSRGDKSLKTIKRYMKIYALLNKGILFRLNKFLFFLSKLTK